MKLEDSVLMRQDLGESGLIEIQRLAGESGLRSSVLNIQRLWDIQRVKIQWISRRRSQRIFSHSETKCTSEDVKHQRVEAQRVISESRSSGSMKLQRVAQWMRSLRD